MPRTSDFARGSRACAALRSPAPLISAAALAGALALAVAFAGQAHAATFNPDNLPSDDIAGVGHICRSVVGAEPGEAQYVGCIESLSDSWTSLQHSRVAAEARSDCLARGLRPGTPDLAVCELRTAGTAPAHRIPVKAGEEPAAGSHFNASPREVHRRNQMSCARLGYEPASGGFANCVANLQASQFAADNPMN
jgi:hypothetical protein